MPEYEVFSQRLSSRASAAIAKCAQVGTVRRGVPE